MKVNHQLGRLRIKQFESVLQDGRKQGQPPVGNMTGIANNKDVPYDSGIKEWHANGPTGILILSRNSKDNETTSSAYQTHGRESIQGQIQTTSCNYATVNQFQSNNGVQTQHSTSLAPADGNQSSTLGHHTSCDEDNDYAQRRQSVLQMGRLEQRSQQGDSSSITMHNKFANTSLHGGAGVSQSIMVYPQLEVSLNHRPEESTVTKSLNTSQRLSTNDPQSVLANAVQRSQHTLGQVFGVRTGTHRPCTELALAQNLKEWTSMSASINLQADDTKQNEHELVREIESTFDELKTAFPNKERSPVKDQSALNMLLRSSHETQRARERTFKSMRQMVAKRRSASQVANKQIAAQRQMLSSSQNTVNILRPQGPKRQRETANTSQVNLESLLSTSLLPSQRIILTGGAALKPKNLNQSIRRLLLSRKATTAGTQSNESTLLKSQSRSFCKIGAANVLQFDSEAVFGKPQKKLKKQTLQQIKQIRQQINSKGPIRRLKSAKIISVFKNGADQAYPLSLTKQQPSQAKNNSPLSRAVMSRMKPDGQSDRSSQISDETIIKMQQNKANQVMCSTVAVQTPMLHDVALDQTFPLLDINQIIPAKFPHELQPYETLSGISNSQRQASSIQNIEQNPNSNSYQHLIMAQGHQVLLSSGSFQADAMQQIANGLISSGGPGSPEAERLVEPALNGMVIQEASGTRRAVDTEGKTSDGRSPIVGLATVEIMKKINAGAAMAQERTFDIQNSPGPLATQDDAAQQQPVQVQPAAGVYHQTFGPHKLMSENERAPFQFDDMTDNTFGALNSKRFVNSNISSFERNKMSECISPKQVMHLMKTDTEPSSALGMNPQAMKRYILGEIQERPSHQSNDTLALCSHGTRLHLSNALHDGRDSNFKDKSSQLNEESSSQKASQQQPPANTKILVKGEVNLTELMIHGESKESAPPPGLLDSKDIPAQRQTAASAIAFADKPSEHVAPISSKSDFLKPVNDSAVSSVFSHGPRMKSTLHQEGRVNIKNNPYNDEQEASFERAHNAFHMQQPVNEVKIRQKDHLLHHHCPQSPGGGNGLQQAQRSELICQLLREQIDEDSMHLYDLTKSTNANGMLKLDSQYLNKAIIEKIKTQSDRWFQIMNLNNSYQVPTRLSPSPEKPLLQANIVGDQIIDMGPGLQEMNELDNALRNRVLASQISSYNDNIVSQKVMKARPAYSGQIIVNFSHESHQSHSSYPDRNGKNRVLTKQLTSFQPRPAMQDFMLASQSSDANHTGSVKRRLTGEKMAVDTLSNGMNGDMHPLKGPDDILTPKRDDNFSLVESALEGTAVRSQRLHSGEHIDSRDAVLKTKPPNLNEIAFYSKRQPNSRMNSVDLVQHEQPSYIRSNEERHPTSRQSSNGFIEMASFDGKPTAILVQENLAYGLAPQRQATADRDNQGTAADNTLAKSAPSQASNSQSPSKKVVTYQIHKNEVHVRPLQPQIRPQAQEQAKPPRRPSRRVMSSQKRILGASKQINKDLDVASAIYPGKGRATNKLAGSSYQQELAKLQRLEAMYREIIPSNRRIGFLEQGSRLRYLVPTSLSVCQASVTFKTR